MPKLYYFKHLKKKQNFNTLSNLVQYWWDNDKVNISNISDINSKSKTWFCNKSINENDNNFEKEKYFDVKEPNLEKGQPSYERLTKLESWLKKIRWNKKRKTKLQKSSKKELHSTLTKKNWFKNQSEKYQKYTNLGYYSNNTLSKLYL